MALQLIEILQIFASIFCLCALPFIISTVRKLATIQANVETLIRDSSWHTDEINKSKDAIHKIELRMATCKACSAVDGN